MGGSDARVSCTFHWNREKSCEAVTKDALSAEAVDYKITKNDETRPMHALATIKRASLWRRHDRGSYIRFDIQAIPFTGPV
jgi:hypothetical protein